MSLKSNHIPIKTSPPHDISSSGWFVRFLNIVERLGNLLPHPITLFALFCVAVILVSGIAGYFELTVADPRPRCRWTYPCGQPDECRRLADDSVQLSH